MSNTNITLEISAPAPHFDVMDIFGRQINLKEYKGKRLLIGFFRHAGCPFCNVRVHRLQKEYESLKAKNMEMIFFFESEEKVLLAQSFHKEVSPIPLIADPENKWYQAYGVEKSTNKALISHFTSILQTTLKAKMQKLPVHWMQDKESFNTIPAEFLVNEYGMVKKAHYARFLNDRMSIDMLYEFAEKGTVTG